MRTDRELLELAARAAGIEFHAELGDWRHEDSCRYWSDGEFCTCGGAWNPLTDDGDALRLAVKLRLSVRLDDPDAACAGIAAGQHGAPTLDGNGPWFRKEWAVDGGPAAATRRAIVRAAAEIAAASQPHVSKGEEGNE